MRRLLTLIQTTKISGFLTPPSPCLVIPTPAGTSKTDVQSLCSDFNTAEWGPIVIPQHIYRQPNNFPFYQIPFWADDFLFYQFSFYCYIRIRYIIVLYQFPFYPGDLRSWILDWLFGLLLLLVLGTST